MGYDEGKGEEDFFGKLIADNTVNTADLASHYAYNPQRWRLFKTNNDESNRLQPAYNTVPEYNHAAGYQLAFATLTPTNTQQFQKGTTDTQSDKKTTLNEQDYAVVLMRSQGTGTSDYLPRFEMDF